jgi:tetratricopeptide (TPR) repeat protein
MLGELDAAERELLDGIGLAEQIGNGDEHGQCLVNLGVVHADRGDPQRALESYRAALPEFERNRARPHLARTHANVADALYELDDDAAALTEAALAITVATEIGHDATLADATDTVALVEARRGNRAAAAAAFETAAAIYARLGATRRAEECRSKAEALREPAPARARRSG